MLTGKLLKDGGYNVLDYVTTLVVFLVTTNFLIDNIGGEGYGFYLFFISLVNMFGLVDIGLGMAVSKYLSEFIHCKRYDECNQVIVYAVAFYTIIGFTMLVVINFFSNNIILAMRFDGVYFKLAPSILLMVSLIFVMNMYISVAMNVLVAQEKWAAISVLNIIFKILTGFFVVIVLMLLMSPYEKIHMVFVVISIATFMKTIICGWYSLSQYGVFKFSLPSKVVRNKISSFLKYSSAQYGLSLIVGHLDKLIISRYFGLEVMGHYGFVLNAFNYMYGFIVNLFKVFYPKLSLMHGKNNYSSLKDAFKMLLTCSFFISLVFSVVAILLWKPVVGVYLNQEFAESTYVYFIFFSVFLVLRSPELVFYYYFNATANPKVLVINLIIGSITTLTCYVMFVPSLKEYGLVLSSMVSSLVIYLSVFVLIKKKGFKNYAC